MMVTVLLFAGVLLGALGAVFCYRLGLTEGSRLAREGRLEKSQSPEEKEKGRLGRILRNIDRYDGTSRRQERVE